MSDVSSTRNSDHRDPNEARTRRGIIDLTETPLAVHAQAVRKTFDRGAVTALHGVTFDVAPGEFVALTGPSGCGKSTLLHLLAGIDRPDSGSLVVDGHDLFRLDQPNRYRRETVGLVFQMHNLLAHLDALANIGVAMLSSDLSRRDQRERATELLDLVGLDGLGRRQPPQLSGGERQRVAIARALANQPKVLLADEPTGSLDSAAKQIVLDLLMRVRTEQKVTLLVVSHDDDVLNASDRVVRMFDGRVAASTPGEPTTHNVGVDEPSLWSARQR